jgi:Uma2 family endonuclease
MTALPKHRMTVEEFVPWAMAQPKGRYELVGGQVFAMAPERARHNLVKLAVARSMQDAVRRAGLDCTVFTDGMTVRIDETTAREPDASLQCGVALDFDCVVLVAPLLVVEVVSPTSERDDTGAKVAEYFSVPSIRHYLIVDPLKPVVIHHRRDVAGAILTSIHSAGILGIDPPGFELAVVDLLGPVART